MRPEILSEELVSNVKSYAAKFPNAIFATSGVGMGFQDGKFTYDVDQPIVGQLNVDVVKPVDFDNFVRTIAQLGFYWLVINEKPR